MGGSNFMQPHAFLPSDLNGNERQRCGSGINSPMRLQAWAERDPFHKQNDQESNSIQSNVDDFIVPVVRPTTTKKPNKPIVDRVDFIPAKPLTTLKPTITTLKSKPLVDNKLDFTTSKRPQKKKPLTTARPKTTTITSSIISNKLDLDIDVTQTSKRPFISPFNKLNNNLTRNLTITTKRPSKKKKKNRPKTTNQRSDDFRDDDIETETETDDIGTIRVTDQRPQIFYNQDNATKYMNNNPISSDRLQLRSRDESRHNYDALPLQQQNQYNDYDYDRYPKPNYYTYPQRPNTYSPILNPTTTRRPVMFQNNKPNYYNFGPDARPAPSDNPTDSPLSLNKVSTPFSYDNYQSGSSVVPQINYENMAIPLYVSANRINAKPVVIRPPHQQQPSYQQQYTTKKNYYQRPTYATTRRADLQTFLIVDTTRRTQTHYIDLKRTTPRPYFTTRLDANYYPVTPQSSNYYYSPSVSSVDHQAYEQNNPVQRPTNFFQDNIRTTTRRIPIYQRPTSTFNIPIPESVFSDHGNNDNDNEDDFDGYLRPEHNHYVPLTNNQKVSYTDYSQFNSKPDIDDTKNVKFYYMGNVLHKKYLQHNPNDGGLHSKQNKRYADFYDKELLTEPNKDEFVRHLIDEVTHITKTKDKDNDETRGLSIGRSKNSHNVLIVPFRVLTKPERPDNWVNTENDDGTKAQLPDVPALDQDNDQVALELPRPYFAKFQDLN